MGSSSVFETCTAAAAAAGEANNANNATAAASSVEELLKCISDGHDLSLGSAASDLAGGLDSFYLIFAGALVFFMQLGFAMLCAGSIRSKNVKNVLLWNLLDSCGGGLAFWATGYAFAYGGEDDGPSWTFCGNANFFLVGVDDLAYWFFQFAFACALSSIVAGTIAERTQMRGYLLYSLFLVGFAYPVVAHAFWSTNGFLSPATSEPLWGTGVIDFAGSGPVHMAGGVAALMAALVLGPRLGRFYDDDGNPLAEPKDIPGHSTPLAILGTFALWFGWYGFNPGSTFGVSTRQAGEVAARVAVNTTLAACSGAVSAMFASTWGYYRREGIHTYDVAYTMNGLLTGLVAVTAPCACVESWAAVVIGAVAGWVYLAGSNLLVKLRIDDAVDAIPVHMFGGAWGLVAAGLFSSPDLMEKAGYGGSPDHVGWFYEWGRGSGNFTLIGAQLVAVLFVLGWTSALMFPFFWIVDYFGSLRVDPLEEAAGMDVSRHNGPGYANEMTAEDLDASLTLSQRRMSSKPGKDAASSPKPEAAVASADNADETNDA